jgi:hypothetical protein
MEAILFLTPLFLLEVEEVKVPLADYFLEMVVLEVVVILEVLVQVLLIKVVMAVIGLLGEEAMLVEAEEVPVEMGVMLVQALLVAEVEL